MKEKYQEIENNLNNQGNYNSEKLIKLNNIIAKKFQKKSKRIHEITKEKINNIVNKKYYITIDIDAFDPSIASGTGTPSHGGFYYYEVLELIDGLTKQGKVIGLDLVEVAPDYDLTNSTSTLAAQLLMNAIGRILYNR